MKLFYFLFYFGRYSSIHEEKNNKRDKIEQDFQNVLVEQDEISNSYFY